MLTDEEFKFWQRKVGLNGMLNMTSNINLSRRQFNLNNSSTFNFKIANLKLNGN